MTAFNPAAYVVQRDFEPKPRNRDGIDFVLTPAERSKAAQFQCQLERRRRDLNALDTAQATADALVRELSAHATTGDLL